MSSNREDQVVGFFDVNFQGNKYVSIDYFYVPTLNSVLLSKAH